MVAVLRSVAWTKNAQVELHNYYNYIFRHSERNAKKVVREIVEALEKARSNPEFYPPDRDKNDNDGMYRAFEKHRCRISYRIEEKEIVIIRARHTKMNPKPY